MAKKSSSSSRKQSTPLQNSLNIEAQVQAFLAGGGEIQQVPKGVSGQVHTSGPKHITLGKKTRG